MFAKGIIGDFRIDNVNSKVPVVAFIFALAMPQAKLSDGRSIEN